MQTPIPRQPPTLDLSADFRTRFGAWRLAQIVIEAVYRVKPGSSIFQNKGETFSEPMLLTVLSYCYASGIYASIEVRQAIEDDETVRYLCARVFPDAEDLRQFRRRNAPAIKQCLIQVFSMAYDDSNPDANVYSTYSDVSLRQMFVASRAWSFAAQAECRVTRAIQADSIALDA